MKKILAVVGLALVLSGCGGYDDMDAAREGMGGIGSHGSDKPSIPSKPSTPSDPNQIANWKYSSVADGDRVFALSATNYSVNTYQQPDYSNLKGKPWVTIERTQARDGKITNTVVIFADSSTSCYPSCSVRMTFDGRSANYRMRNNIDGVLRPIDDSTGNTLFKKFTTSNIAIVELPIIGLFEPFSARFNLSGYVIKKMKFISE